MTGSTIESGRWMLYVLAEIERFFFGNGYFSLPLANGMFALVCIGVTAGLMTVHFKIRSLILSALLGAVMAAFPVITALFGFVFTIHYYMHAMVMLVMGSILICDEKSRWKNVLGVLICGCAIGVYQAFVPVMLMILMMDLMRKLIQREEKAGYFLREALRMLLCAVAVMAVYFAGSRYFLWSRNVQLDDYLGISSVSSTPLGIYLAGAGTAYREYFHPSRFVTWDMYPMSALNLYRLMMILDAVMGTAFFVRVWKKSRLRALMLLLVLSLVPLGCNFAFVMSEQVHSLMVYGQVMQMVLMVCLAEWTENEKRRYPDFFRKGAAILLLLIYSMYCRYDNQCYLKITLQQQEAISWNTTLVTRIESAEGFRDVLPVAFVNRENMEDHNLYNLDEMGFLSLATYDANTQEFLNDWAWKAFLERWCGFAPEFADVETVETWPEVQKMPTYPDDGSIQVIHDVVVVKF